MRTHFQLLFSVGHTQGGEGQIFILRVTWDWDCNRISLEEMVLREEEHDRHLKDPDKLCIAAMHHHFN